MKHGGIPTEDSYGPYLGQDGYCHLDRAKMALKIKGWVNVTSGKLNAMIKYNCFLFIGVLEFYRFSKSIKR